MSVGSLAMAGFSFESYLAPLVQFLIFRLTVGMMIQGTATGIETSAPKMIRHAHGNVLSSALYGGRASHFGDDVVELGLTNHGFEVVEMHIHLGVAYLLRFGFLFHGRLVGGCWRGSRNLGEVDGWEFG